jgi:hypothetical protein
LLGEGCIVFVNSIEACGDEVKDRTRQEPRLVIALDPAGRGRDAAARMTATRQGSGWGAMVLRFLIVQHRLVMSACSRCWCVARRVVPAVAVAASVGAATAAMAQTTLADVKSIQCTFTRQATGSWTKSGALEAAVSPSSLVLRFEGIDTETGTAQLRNGAMMSDVIVRLTEGYLHLMQAFRTGPLYTTTVFEAGGRTGVFRAAHSRHELFATPLPGATSSPEQYYGTCQVRP